MSYEILYADKVVKNDIPKISGLYKTRIKQAIETKLVSQPDLYGKPLRKSLKSYFKLRVGDYRIIFRIENKIIRNATPARNDSRSDAGWHGVASGKVKIFVIAHRRVVYEVMGGRI